jgi:CheY-like chemotaxis protein
VLEQDKATPVILIVDDETLIRLAAVQIAEDEGFEVVDAANADEAIEILEGRDDIRVIFTDIHMPGSMDGLKLAHAVRGGNTRKSPTFRRVAGFFPSPIVRRKFKPHSESGRN